MHRVRPEGGFKNRNRKPDLPKHNSGSCYRNRNIFFYIPVPVNPETEFQFLVPVLAKQEPEIGFHRISIWNSPQFIIPIHFFMLKVHIYIKYAFTTTILNLKNIFQIPFAFGYESGMYRNFINHIRFTWTGTRIFKSCSGSVPVSGRIIRFRSYPTGVSSQNNSGIVSQNY